MTNKYLRRIFTWAILMLLCTGITFFLYRTFITNGVKKEIEEEKRISETYDGTYGKIAMIENRIDIYNNRIYDDNTFTQMIPDYYDDNEVLSKYVNRPILLSGATLQSVNITEGMPKNIKWSSSNNSRDIKGIKVSVNFEVPNIHSLESFIGQLQASVRSVYLGDIKFTLPGETATDSTTLKISMTYYLFYRDVKTT